MDKPQPASGQTLVADYQTVFVSAATVEVAKYEAERSESELVGQLETISAGTYLNPGNLATNDQDLLTRASLDAHIKKVQTRQLNDMNAGQVQNLIEQDQAAYKNRKVTVTVLPDAEKPIDMVWFDPQHGFRTSSTRKKSVTGIIEEVVLDRNVLILRPTWSQKMFNSRLQNYFVYIIDPASFKPMVTLTVS